MAARRFGLALLASTCAHAALLANATFVPTIGELSLFAAAQPMRVRLLPVQAASAADTAQRRPDTPPPGAAVLAPAAERQSLPAGLPGAPIYYRARELDERAMPLNQVDVVYPETALAAGTRGVVTLRLLIDHEGSLRDASVTDSRPAGVFENAALEAVMALRFRPAMRNGVAVGSIKIIEVPFDPDCTRTGSCIE